MDFAELQERVNAYVKLDLRPLFDAYQAESGSSSIEGFIDFLLTARVIDASLVTQLHTAGPVEIPKLDDPVLAQTNLGAWAQRITDAGTVVAPWVKAGAAGATKPRMTATGTVIEPPPTGAASSASAAPAAPAAPAVPAAPAAPAADIRYSPMALLGQGAMGAVHIARDVYLRRKVALKTILPEMATHPSILGRFVSEMQITAQLEHPNIVPIYALELGADGSLGYAMKLVHGRDLATLLRDAKEMTDKGQPLDEDHTLDKRLDCFLKVCDALDAAHGKGIVHRDLKPANIMVGPHNDVYLMDWGIARPMGKGGSALEAGLEIHQDDGEQAAHQARTRLGTMIGTPAYMSPEQAAGRNDELDGRSDQYAMGLILQECVSLQRAVGGTTLQEILTKAKEGRRDPVAIGDKHGHIPREIHAIVAKATSSRPADRYPSVRALADDVRRHLRNEAVLALPDSALRKASRWVSKHRMASLALMLAIALVGAGATIASLVVAQARIAALHARELRVSQLQTESAIQAQMVDHELARYEVALAQLVGAAQRAFVEPASDGPPPLFVEQLGQPGAAPADFGPSKRYGKPVSVLAPVVALAPGVDRAGLDPLLRSFGALSPAFREVMIDTDGGRSHKMSAEQQRDAIAETGVPGLRAVVGLNEGATLIFPAASDAAAGDPRQDPMYKLVEDTTGVHWGVPVLRDKEMVLPAGAALYDEKGALRGDAVLEVSLARLLSRPSASKLDFVQSRLLVSRDGKVMAEDNTASGRAPLSPQVLEAIAMGRSGTLEYEEAGVRWISAFYPLASLDWYFVAIADVRKMLDSTSKFETSDPRKVMAAAAPSASSPGASPALAPPSSAAPTSEPSAQPSAAPSAQPSAAPSAQPSAALSAKPSSAPSAKSSAAPSAKPSGPRNPFEKWPEYDKKK